MISFFSVFYILESITESFVDHTLFFLPISRGGWPDKLFEFKWARVYEWNFFGEETLPMIIWEVASFRTIHYILAFGY